MTLMVTWHRCWTWNWNWTLAVVGSQILCPWCGSHFLLCSTPLSHRKPGPKPVVPRCQWRVSHIHSYYSHGHISHPLTQLSLTPPRPLSSFLLQACVPHLAVARTDVRHFVCARVARDLIIFFFSFFPFLLFFFFLAFIMLRARARLASEERERVGCLFGGALALPLPLHMQWGPALIKCFHVACFHFDVRHFEFFSLWCECLVRVYVFLCMC